MADDLQHQIELRLVKIETIIGNKDSGLMADIHNIKADVEDLKRYRWQLLGGVTVIVAIFQIVGAFALKYLLTK